MTDAPTYTMTEQRILTLLADGQPHPREALLPCLWDADQGTLATVRVHVCNIRKQLRPLGQTIVCELAGGRLCYRQIRLLSGT